MFLYSGKGVSKGIGKGPLHFINNTTEEKYNADVLEEQVRLKQAVENTISQLKELAEKNSENKEVAQILEVHSLLAEDASFLSRINSILFEEECNAEYAVNIASKQISNEFKQIPDDYISERGADIEDVAYRITHNLSGNKELIDLINIKSIVVVEELLPSQVLKMTKEKIAGVICINGSYNSHAAILLRSLGIPAVFCINKKISQYYEGLFTYLDGSDGSIAILPDEEAEADYETRIDNQFYLYESIQIAREKEDISSDGRKLSILCNINLPQDVDNVIDSSAKGIGLFRTEFLFLKSGSIPTESQQYEAYKHVVSMMNGKKVVIRTLDITADKTTSLLRYFNIDGSRTNDNGIRFCLNRVQIFKAQLRAIYRASAYGEVYLLLPGIMRSSEIVRAKNLCDLVKLELNSEGIEYNQNIKLGAMIETKEAMSNLSDIVNEVDFVSIGTNDLTLALLAPDKYRNEPDDNIDYHNEKIINAINEICCISKEKGITVSVCGELAADEDMLSKFLDMGIDEISVIPQAVLPLRYILNDL